MIPPAAPLVFHPCPSLDVVVHLFVFIGDVFVPFVHVPRLIFVFADDVERAHRFIVFLVAFAGRGVHPVFPRTCFDWHESPPDLFSYLNTSACYRDAQAQVQERHPLRSFAKRDLGRTR
jgi:hypothetical protein